MLPLTRCWMRYGGKFLGAADGRKETGLTPGRPGDGPLHRDSSGAIAVPVRRAGHTSRCRARRSRVRRGQRRSRRTDDCVRLKQVIGAGSMSKRRAAGRKLVPGPVALAAVRREAKAATGVSREGPSPGAEVSGATALRRTAGYETRTSGGVGDGGRESPSYPIQAGVPTPPRRSRPRSRPGRPGRPVETRRTAPR